MFELYKSEIIRAHKVVNEFGEYGGAVPITHENYTGTIGSGVYVVDNGNENRPNKLLIAKMRSIKDGGASMTSLDPYMDSVLIDNMGLCMLLFVDSQGDLIYFNRPQYKSIYDEDFVSLARNCFEYVAEGLSPEDAIMMSTM